MRVVAGSVEGALRGTRELAKTRIYRGTNPDYNCQTIIDGKTYTILPPREGPGDSPWPF